MDRRRLMLEAWDELGRPVLSLGGQTGRNTVPHPLIQMLREVDILCDRLGKSVRARHVGRPVGSAAPDRREPPRVVLRSEYVTPPSARREPPEGKAAHHTRALGLRAAGRAPA
jgi:hypothetical protein